MRRLIILAVLVMTSLSATTAVQLQVRARAVQPGEVVLITVTTPPAADRVEAEAFGARVPGFRVDDTTWRLLIGIDLDTKAAVYPVTVRIDAAGTTGTLMHRLDVRAKAFRTRRLTVAPAFVTPPPEVQARIEAEAIRLNAIYAGSDPVPLWSGPFLRPVPHAANSAFGTRSILNGEPRSPHSGADFASPAGTPVRAPNAGRVALAGDLYYTGGTVVIDHGLGLISFFAHLSKVDAVEGALVEPGQVVGRVGATGRVTGPHLHWTVRLAGTRVDPLSLLAVLGQ